MKNVYVFSLALLISTGLQSMEEENILFTCAKEQVMEQKLILSISTDLQSMKQQEELLDVQEAQNILKANVKISVLNYLNVTDKSNLNIKKILKKTKWATGSNAEAKEAIQEYRDEHDNTITHLLVMNTSAENLSICAEKGLIVFTKNIQGKTPLDIALKQFSEDVDNMLKDDDSDYPTNTRCCLYILSAYIKQKNLVSDKKIDICPMCCPEHGLTSYH